MYIILVLFVISAVYLIYLFITRNNTYWKDRNVPFIEPAFFYGSVKDQICKKNRWADFSADCYKMFKNSGIGGVFYLTVPMLYVCDLKLIEKILIEDFSFFQDRWLQDDQLSSSLTFGRGEDWRNTRLRLSPAFGCGKVKAMFQQIFTAVNRNLRTIDDSIEKNDTIEMETLTTGFSTEVIASCMFGVDMSDSYESIQLKRCLEEIYATWKKRSVIMLLGMTNPKLLNFFKFPRTSKNASQTLANIIKDIILFRMKNIKTRRNDVLQVMLDLQENVGESNDISKKDFNQGNENVTNNPSNTISQRLEGHTFSSKDICCLMHNFLFSGIKPTAVTITFALFEIARHSHIQKSVQREIDSSLKKFKVLNSEALESMTYLDQVIQETLRLHSFTNTIMRIVTKSYTLPGTNVTLDKDMRVFVPIDAIHKDPEFYPDPHEFKPERFEGHNYKPTMTFLPFGQGPRICVAIRLATTMVKLYLARILAQYEVKISKKMKMPLELSESDVYPRAKGGMWLQLEKRQQA